MTTRQRRVAVLVLASAAVAAALAWPVWPALRVNAGGGTVGYVALEDHERVGIAFRHSVDGLPVEDWYVVRDGRLVQESTRMRQYGAGMGNTPSDGTGRAVGGWWEVRDMHRDIGTLVLRTGAAAVDHRLHYPGGEVSLSACWPRDRVTVRPVRVGTVSRVLFAWRRPGCER